MSFSTIHSRRSDSVSWKRLSNLLVLLGTMTTAQANPNGGAFSAGTGTISGQGTNYVTVNQNGDSAIINWQSFSLGRSDTTQFIQPSASSIALNRVLGGSISQIDGSIIANGQIILINQNGIVIGPTGTINTASFVASTRDISDIDFTSGTLHFIGSNANGVLNQGTISALGGDVVLLGKTVSNSGTINAASGLASLDAADDLLLAQKDGTGGVVTVTASLTATAAPTSTGVDNEGTINAARTELRAANGNLYALAINNGGVIRATTLTHQGGHILLTADGGKVKNAGKLDASATAKGGQGGSVDIINKNGLAANTGTILARGGQGGTGGTAELSGAQLDMSGSVDLTAPDGVTGTFTLDPTNLVVEPSGGSTINSDGVFYDSGNDATISPGVIETALDTANVTLDGDNSITIDAAINSTSPNFLTLNTPNIYLYAPINVGALAANEGLQNTYLGAGGSPINAEMLSSYGGKVTVLPGFGDNPPTSSMGNVPPAFDQIPSSDLIPKITGQINTVLASNLNLGAAQPRPFGGDYTIVNSSISNVNASDLLGIGQVQTGRRGKSTASDSSQDVSVRVNGHLVLRGQSFQIGGGALPPQIQILLQNILNQSVHDELSSALLSH